MYLYVAVSSHCSFTQTQREKTVTPTKQGFLIRQITTRPYYGKNKKFPIWKILTKPSSDFVHMFHINLSILAFIISYALISGVLVKLNIPGHQNRLAKWVVQNSAVHNISKSPKNSCLVALLRNVYFLTSYDTTFVRSQSVGRDNLPLGNLSTVATLFVKIIPQYRR